MTNKIGDLIYYKKPIEKSHNQQTENILCEIIKSNDDNIVTLKRIFSKDNEVNEWEIKNEDLGLKTENVWTDVKHIISAGFEYNTMNRNGNNIFYYQLNDIILFIPNFNLIDKDKYNRDIVIDGFQLWFHVSKDLNFKSFLEKGYFEKIEFKKEYKEVEYLNDFIRFLKSEKIEYNLNEMLSN